MNFLKHLLQINNKPKTPLLAVDGIVETHGGIVLIKRKNPPYGWALPGGFVDVGETVDFAIDRELVEEISVMTYNHQLFGVYSDPDRDPRGHVVSIVYTMQSIDLPYADDDAAEAIVIEPQYALDTLDLAFDHRQIIKDYLWNTKSD